MNIGRGIVAEPSRDLFKQAIKPETMTFSRHTGHRHELATAVYWTTRCLRNSAPPPTMSLSVASSNMAPCRRVLTLLQPALPPAAARTTTLSPNRQRSALKISLRWRPLSHRAVRVGRVPRLGGFGRARPSKAAWAALVAPRHLLRSRAARATDRGSFGSSTQCRSRSCCPKGGRRRAVFTEPPRVDLRSTCVSDGYRTRELREMLLAGFEAAFIVDAPAPGAYSNDGRCRPRGGNGLRREICVEQGLGAVTPAPSAPRSPPSFTGLGRLTPGRVASRRGRLKRLAHVSAQLGPTLLEARSVLRKVKEDYRRRRRREATFTPWWCRQCGRPLASLAESDARLTTHFYLCGRPAADWQISRCSGVPLARSRKCRCRSRCYTRPILFGRSVEAMATT